MILAAIPSVVLKQSVAISFARPKAMRIISSNCQCVTVPTRVIYKDSQERDACESAGFGSYLLHVAAPQQNSKFSPSVRNPP